MAPDKKSNGVKKHNISKARFLIPNNFYYLCAIIDYN